MGGEERERERGVGGRGERCTNYCCIHLSNISGHKVINQAKKMTLKLHQSVDLEARRDLAKTERDLVVTEGARQGPSRGILAG